MANNPKKNLAESDIGACITAAKESKTPIYFTFGKHQTSNLTRNIKNDLMGSQPHKSNTHESLTPPRLTIPPPPPLPPTHSPTQQLEESTTLSTLSKTSSGPPSNTQPDSPNESSASSSGPPTTRQPTHNDPLNKSTRETKKKPQPKKTLYDKFLSELEKSINTFINVNFKGMVSDKEELININILKNSIESNCGDKDTGDYVNQLSELLSINKVLIDITPEDIKKYKEEQELKYDFIEDDIKFINLIMHIFNILSTKGKNLTLRKKTGNKVLIQGTQKPRSGKNKKTKKPRPTIAETTEINIDNYIKSLFKRIVKFLICGKYINTLFPNIYTYIHIKNLLHVLLIHIKHKLHIKS